MDDQRTAPGHGDEGRCKACGSRPAVPAATGGRMLCAHCAAELPLPDGAGLVEDEGAAVRRNFEDCSARPHA
ncbi:hypothetical protein [Streptomyces sp. CRN 30]|uniref:hypothetical protein n=1 Tax=Streptomyces sp. CRN 30 TaxID=3075613 RepID=UPI002A7FBE47|nr:hypothetical protein [Streptomyces sp. CRN 30]